MSEVYRPASPAQISARNRRTILENVLATLKKRFYSPETLNEDWEAAVARHRPNIENANTADIFEQSMSSLLAELHTSHVGFFHRSARRASSRAALSATYIPDDTPYGRRWIFQDVHAGGTASMADVESGDILLSVNGLEVVPPEHPVFAMGTQTKVRVVGREERPRIATVDVATPKGKKLHFVEPRLVEARRISERLGCLKIAMFPGLVGVDVANEISSAIEKLGPIERLIIDLRGNTGGGIGALRVMSLLTPDRIPVGFALDRGRVPSNVEAAKYGFPRFSEIPRSKNTLWRLALRFAPAMVAKKPIVLQTEGLGVKPFHGGIALLVNRHTASAAEMIVAFAKENNLAAIIGEKTAGRLLSATSVKVGKGFRLALPTGGYHTWGGWTLEGSPIAPDLIAEFDWRQRRNASDGQLERAVEFLRDERTARVI